MLIPISYNKNIPHASASVTSGFWSIASRNQNNEMPTIFLSILNAAFLLSHLEWDNN